MKLIGHNLKTIDSNGERGREDREWLGTCECGWYSSSQRQADVLSDHREHRKQMKEQLMKEQTTEQKILRERAGWERGLTPIYVRDESKTVGRVLVVLEKKALATALGKTSGPVSAITVYHCHRYFQSGSDWTTSVDGQNLPLEAVWTWLMSPCAAATRPPYNQLTKVSELL